LIDRRGNRGCVFIVKRKSRLVGPCAISARRFFFFPKAATDHASDTHQGLDLAQVTAQAATCARHRFHVLVPSPECGTQRDDAEFSQPPRMTAYPEADIQQLFTKPASKTLRHWLQERKTTIA